MFEYKVIISSNEADAILRECNIAGKEGWRFAFILHDLWLYFIRERINSPNTDAANDRLLAESCLSAKMKIKVDKNNLRM